MIDSFIVQNTFMFKKIYLMLLPLLIIVVGVAYTILMGVGDSYICKNDKKVSLSKTKIEISTRDMKYSAARKDNTILEWTPSDPTLPNTVQESTLGPRVIVLNGETCKLID